MRRETGVNLWKDGNQLSRLLWVTTADVVFAMYVTGIEKQHGVVQYEPTRRSRVFD